MVVVLHMLVNLIIQEVVVEELLQLEDQVQALVV